MTLIDLEICLIDIKKYKKLWLVGSWEITYFITQFCMNMYIDIKNVEYMNYNSLSSDFHKNKFISNHQEIVSLNS